MSSNVLSFRAFEVAVTEWDVGHSVTIGQRDYYKEKSSKCHAWFSLTANRCSICRYTNLWPVITSIIFPIILSKAISNSMAFPEYWNLNIHLLVGLGIECEPTYPLRSQAKQGKHEMYLSCAWSKCIPGLENACYDNNTLYTKFKTKQSFLRTSEHRLTRLNQLIENTLCRTARTFIRYQRTTLSLDMADQLFTHGIATSINCDQWNSAAR